MKPRQRKALLIFIVLFSMLNAAFSQIADKMMIVIIDGARYTETFGDPTYKYIPKMKALSQEGTLLDNFANNNYTYTSRAIPALWCGAWTAVEPIVYQGTSTQYAVLPTLFEYYRKQKNKPAEDCVYVLKYVPSLWLPSFDIDYGPNYWPEFHSVGSSDQEVATQAQMVMADSHPHFMLVYLAEVDHAGHLGIWENYTASIQTADSIVGVLWEKLQSDPFYKNSTTLIVTNDHGRHDDQHGGFQNHGCSCEGCRHIQFLAVGPDIKKNFVSTQYRNIPDMTVTASYLLGIQPQKATGNTMYEIFNFTGTNEEIKPTFARDATYPNPFSKSTNIRYYIERAEHVRLSIFSVSGEKIITLKDEWESQGNKSIRWDAKNAHGQRVVPGIYFYKLQVGNKSETGKLILTNDS